MSKPDRILKEIEQALDRYGIRVTGDEPGRKNRRLTITNGMRTAVMITSLTPSDHRAKQNIAHTARRLLREAP
jgi:hypothetical protein